MSKLMSSSITCCCLCLQQPVAVVGILPLAARMSASISVRLAATSSFCRMTASGGARTYWCPVVDGPARIRLDRSKICMLLQHTFFQTAVCAFATAAAHNFHHNFLATFLSVCLGKSAWAFPHLCGLHLSGVCVCHLVHVCHCPTTDAASCLSLRGWSSALAVVGRVAPTWWGLPWWGLPWLPAVTVALRLVITILVASAAWFLRAAQDALSEGTLDNGVQFQGPLACSRSSARSCEPLQVCHVP